VSGRFQRVSGAAQGASCSYGTEWAVTFSLSSLNNVSDAADVTFVLVAVVPWGDGAVAGASAPYVWRWVNSTTSPFSAPLAWNDSGWDTWGPDNSGHDYQLQGMSAEVAPRLAGGNNVTGTCALLAVGGADSRLVSFANCSANVLLQNLTAGMVLPIATSSLNAVMAFDFILNDDDATEPFGGPDLVPWRRTYGGVYALTRLSSGRVLLVCHGENAGFTMDSYPTRMESTVQARNGTDWHVDQYGLRDGWNAVRIRRLEYHRCSRVCWRTMWLVPRDY
jgi:hypothetical protein